jgi:hypothetical protein
MEKRNPPFGGFVLVHHTARFLSWFSATDEIANPALPIAQAASDTDSSARRFKKRQHIASDSGVYGVRNVNAQLIATLLTGICRALSPRAVMGRGRIQQDNQDKPSLAKRGGGGMKFCVTSPSDHAIICRRLG